MITKAGELSKAVDADIAERAKTFKLAGFKKKVGLNKSCKNVK